MDSVIKVHLIPNEMCRRAGVAGTFRSTNEILIYPSQYVQPRIKDAPSPYSTNTEAKVFQVRPEVILFHPIMRRLVNESSGVFTRLQAELSADPEKTVDLLHYSIEYRSVIRACLENLNEEVMRTNGLENEQLQNLVTIFYSVECIWHLCEILYIKQLPGNMVKTHLLEWVRFHIPKYERKMLKLKAMYTGSGLENEPEYWDIVIGCLLHGRIEEVRCLLEMHSNASTSPFRDADATLKALPILENHVEIALTKFNLRRKHWLVETQSKIDSGVFESEKNLDFMMRLVVGEEMAWNQVQSKCEAWYELLAAWTFYTDPTLRTYELGRYAKKCIAYMRVQKKRFDYVLLAAMMQHVDLITEIQSMNEHGWFVTHLTDLLCLTGHLETWKTSDESVLALREAFILEYGTLLMGHSSMWQIGLNYLDACATNGKAAIELLLPRIAKTEAQASRVIREATKRGLFQTAQSIARVQCMHYVRHHRIGNALIWALKAQDYESINHLVNQLLRQYQVSYELHNYDLLAHLGKCMMASDSLIFIGKYYEYRKLAEMERHKEAAAELVSLIGSKFTPKFFWDVLLSDALRLLELKESAIGSNASLIIINHLEERAEHIVNKDKLNMLRMALARNMAKVVVQPQIS